MGDRHGLPIPADIEALRTAGLPFLNEAFRVFGALAADNRVTRITEFRECPGGSTGRKLLLAVDYAQPAAGLRRELFVKFSRDFDDPIRDRARTQMEREIAFAQLASAPGFPIAVPVCLYADYHRESGTGILITERIAFGRERIEPHYDKCLDDALPDPLAHYEALLTSVARLAGAQRAGRLGADVAERFAYDPALVTVGQRAPYTVQQLQNRVARYADFAERHPGLLPANIRAPAFIAQLRDEVARFPAQEAAIRRQLEDDAESSALCHWNANIDNAWFWRHADGHLECGLLDWGCVSLMNVAMAIWGALSGARTQLWDDHLDALLALFVSEFRAAGGPALDVARLRQQLLRYVAIMGLAWLLDAPPYIRAQVPELDEVRDRFDPRLRGNEVARVQLQMLTNFLNLWQTRDFGSLLDDLPVVPNTAHLP
ncbi:hypothetical protein [Solimonas terrae]|uniref:Phosphotransferase n=1 Tax=Solimonas terrae TaxID=1396819 RepID=A0A6M2BM22_9GAMM|nr:hypothetical protein [Solimonas terrae]